MQKTRTEGPYRHVFSLKPLIDYWNQTITTGYDGWGPLWEGIREKLAHAPDLQGPVEDLSLLKPHSDLIKSLMSVVFPAAYWDTEAIGALVPYSLEPVFVSPKFRRLLLNDDGSFRGRLQMKQEDFMRAKLMRCCLMILRKCYGIQKDLDYPLVMVITDMDTGLDRYFNIRPDPSFVSVHPVGQLKQLTDQERVTIMEHLNEPEVIMGILPPENFELHGFAVVHAVEVTHSEVISALERDLIDTDSFVSDEGFSRLQQRLRILVRRPELSAGLCAIRTDQVFMLNKGCEMRCHCIFSDSRHIPITEFQGSVFDRAVTSRKILTIRDLMQEPARTAIDEDILRNGIRSMLIAPLFYQGELIGTLDLGSPDPGDFGPAEAMLLHHILPLISVALKRSLDALNNNVERIIKEQCTAVHPAVEWRFRQAVLHHLERSARGEPSELEPIVFRDVFPLYGASDVRGSSEARSRAIQADIVEHLKLADNIVCSAQAARPLPILNELGYQIDRQLDVIQHGLSTGDEIAVLNFLREELEPLFPMLQGYGAGVSDVVKAYRQIIDVNMGTVYRERRDFEKSIALLNQRISSYLDQEEAEAQAMFPHYFNKHQTDGVDYLIYLGPSMVENADFNELYVRNLRLWQIMVACGIAWHVHSLRTDIKVPLDATHLILVNHSPVSIRFRFDEKRFDVDGAYDIAHEIIRSRIDKATVKGRNERLTQPEKIAIVYSRPDELREMNRHINFLQDRGFLNDDIELLDLNDLPGVPGLKALRVGVNIESPALAERAGRG